LYVEREMNNDCTAAPDSELVQRCRDGDEAAFETLYHRYRLPLYSYLSRLVPERATLVDDLYQETWVRVLEYLPRYREQSRFLSLLFRIAHNLAMDNYRHEARIETIEIGEDFPASTPFPWETLDRDEQASALEAALADLSPVQREVVLLRQQGVPFKEIADLQRTSINTVLGRMHLAVRRIRDAVAARLA
jgi:RNA polymerase sigma-70 factor (ECF subfamily)